MSKHEENGVALAEETGEKGASKVNVKSTTMLSPTDIKVDPALNVSRWKPVAQDKVENLAFRMSRQGNRVPVNVRRIGGGGVQLVAGYTRHRAGMLIIEGFDYTDPIEGTVSRVHDVNFKLAT